MRIVVTNAMHELPEVPDVEINGLITLLHNMVWKYFLILKVPPTVLGFPGKDDHKSLFKLLRIGFNAEDK